MSPIASELSANARRVLKARYLRRDEHRQVIETPDQLFARVAEAVAGAECLLDNDGGFTFWRDEFHRMLAALEFPPNSPTLMNAGTAAGQLSACFVLPVPDTVEGIFEAVKQMALVPRTGGGTGFSFSRLRPKGDPVSSTGGESCGPVSFMRIFDCATESIRQGANMGVLRFDHPDILEFIEANRYPASEIADISRANRKQGLGVMGFAEALIRLGIAYDSPEAVAFAGRPMAFIEAAALQASEELAVERGTFAHWRGSLCETKGQRVRNATRNAIAPTGTIGIIADTTPGIEPLSALAHRHVNVPDGQTPVDVNRLFHDWLERHGSGADDVVQHVQRHGNLAGCPGVSGEASRLFVTALEIPPEQHLQIQAAFQRHTDNSVSKTINLPCEATREVVARAYVRAHALGLKGVTAYRHGSKSSQVLELGAEETPAHFEHGARCDPQECRP